MLNNESHIYCYVGYSKAFDFVNRQNLWYKLIQQSIQHRIFTIIQSIYDKEMFYLMTHSAHFNYSYMASDIW